MSAVGDRIRELRIAQSVSQRTLAEKVEVGFPHISKIEAGKEPASTELILRIAEALSADADELLLLAERLPEELTDLVREKRVLAPQFLRSWADGTITDADVARLLKKKRGG